MTTPADEMTALCEKKERVYIYGAGKNAADLFRFLRGQKIGITGFLVSDLSHNPKTLFGYPVSAVHSFFDLSEYIILVPAYRDMKSYKEICDCLIDTKIGNVYFMSKNLLEFIGQEVLKQKMKEWFCTGRYYLREDLPAEAGHEILAMKNEKGEECHWRFSHNMVRRLNPEGPFDPFPNRTPLEEFEAQYGTYHVMHKGASPAANDAATYAVYMARSHVDKAAVPERLPSWIIPIQVGAALTDYEICAQKDDEGETISNRNGNYSECTAIYWMWKNAPRTDYIGLCHYRRHFDLGENEIRQLGARDVDALVTSPTFVYRTVGVSFAEFIPTADLKVMLEVIRRDWPDYKAAAEDFLSSRFYPPCNLFVMKYDLFLQYSEFVFSVTFAIEEYYHSIGFYRNDRYMGFLIECLLGIFLMKKKEQLKIACADMRFYV